VTNDFDEEEKAEEAAQKAYLVAVNFNNELYGKDKLGAEKANNNALGNNMLKTDLGLFNEPSSLMFGDSLDNRTRDRLISNSRQDIAAACGHAESAFEAAYQARAIARRTALLAWVILTVNLVVLLVVL